MAITLSKVAESVFGNLRVGIYDLAGDAAGYAAGGYALTPANLGLRRIHFAHIQGKNAVAGGLLADFDYANNTFIVKYPTGGGAASPAALADPVGATGAVAVTSSAATLPIVPGRGKEVANATDLTTATWRLLVVGE